MPIFVLVLEDEPLILLDIVEALEAAGFTTVPASSIIEALKAVEDQPIDVASIDDQVRGLSCGALASHLDNRGIPFVVCSGDSVERIHWANREHYVSKPFHRHTLANTLRAAVANAH